MNCFVDKLRQLFHSKTEDSCSSKKSFFRLAPCTFIIASILGIPLSSHSKSWHRILLLATLSLRVWLTYTNIRPDFTFSLASIAQLSYYILGYMTFILIYRKKSDIASFVKSNAHLRWKLRKIDLLSLFLYSLVVVIIAIPLMQHKQMEYEANWAHSSFLSLKKLLFSLLFFYQIIWLQMAPLTAILYTLGYCVLYNLKCRTLAQIFTHWDSVNFRPLLFRLKIVSKKHQQFEAIFGPLLLICLIYNFILSVYFFYNLKLVSAEKGGGRGGMYYFFIAFFVYIMSICISLILCVSHFNEKLKDLSNFVSDEIKTRLSDNFPANCPVITFLEKQINKTINEPMTACKLVTVDKQTVLAIAASCVSFAVLLIQIHD